MPNKKMTPRQKALAAGYRSGLEECVAKDLEYYGIDAEYESKLIRYVKPARNARYTPDFVLPNGIIIETKGRFVTDDRQKHILIKDQHPDLEIRFVFSNPRSRISKKSPTTYAMWCDKNGFAYAKGSIPQVWIDEAICQRRIEALEKAGLK